MANQALSHGSCFLMCLLYAGKPILHLFAIGLNAKRPFLRNLIEQTNQIIKYRSTLWY